MTQQTTLSKKIKGGPDLILSADDKIYLAIAYKQAGQLAFIHMLACHKKNGREYYADAQSQVLTFKRPSVARVYYETLLQIQQMQSSTKLYQGLSQFNKDAINTFNQNQH